MTNADLILLIFVAMMPPFMGFCLWLVHDLSVKVGRVETVGAALALGLRNTTVVAAAVERIPPIEARVKQLEDEYDLRKMRSSSNGGGE